ncbi:hypothetical protein [Vallitalea pronyensis]|nr:hypothetical protein [Vallitalea pronyensis]
MNSILKKLTNTKTIIAIASAIILILTSLGVEVDNEQVMTVIKALCSIGVLLGIINDNGMKTTHWNK